MKKNKSLKLISVIIICLMFFVQIVFAPILSGPSSPTANTVPKFTSSKQLSASAIVIDSSDNITGVGNLYGTSLNISGATIGSGAGLTNILRGIFSGVGTLPNNTTSYHTPQGGGASTASDVTARSITPVAGILCNLYVELSADPATDVVFTIMTNGVASSLTCTVAGSGSVTTANDTFTSIIVSAGDKISLRDVTTANLTATTVSWGFLLK